MGKRKGKGKGEKIVLSNAELSNLMGNGSSSNMMQSKPAADLNALMNPVATRSEALQEF